MNSKWRLNTPLDEDNASIPEHLLHHEPHQVIRRPIMAKLKRGTEEEPNEIDIRESHAYGKLLERYKTATFNLLKNEKYIETLEKENSALGKKVEDMSWIDASIYPPTIDLLTSAYNACILGITKERHMILVEKAEDAERLTAMRYYKVIEPAPVETDIEGSVKYEVNWQYKISSYTYHKDFETLEEAKKFIETSEDIVDAINIRILEITTKVKEISHESR